MSDKMSVSRVVICLLAVGFVLCSEASAQFRGRGGMRFYRPPSAGHGGFDSGGRLGFGGAPRDDQLGARDGTFDARDDARGSRDDARDSRDDARDSRDDARGSRDDARGSRDDARDARIDSGRYVRPLPYVPIGAHVGVLPAGCRNVLVGGSTYHYYGGAFYLASGDGYQTVAAPIGATLTALPAGYTQIVVNGQVYYYYQGVFWQLDAASGLYVVVQAPAGAVVPVLPTGYSTTHVGGMRYFAYGGVNYRAHWVGGGRQFSVVGR